MSCKPEGNKRLIMLRFLLRYCEQSRASQICRQLNEIWFFLLFHISNNFLGIPIFMSHGKILKIFLTTHCLALIVQDFVAINICGNNFIDRFPSTGNKFPFVVSTG